MARTIEEVYSDLEEMGYTNLTQHPLYSLYSSLKQKCYNPNHRSYDNYGGRGIVMDEQWKDDFISFVEYIEDELGDKPPGMSLDRIDNERGYEPDNVRWATVRVQNSNRRTYTNGGKTKDDEDTHSVPRGTKEREVHIHIHIENLTLNL